MMVRQTSTKLTAVVIVLMMIVSAFATTVVAQEGEFNIANDDGRLNGETWMGGLAVYCVDANKNSAPTYANGGFRILDPQGEEMLFVPVETVNQAYMTMAETGQYVTLGTSARAWYGGNPVGFYLLPNGYFQVNAADEYEKPVEFIFQNCRTFTTSTGDGCNPGWDRDDFGNCVYLNLY